MEASHITLEPQKKHKNFMNYEFYWLVDKGFSIINNPHNQQLYNKATPEVQSLDPENH